MAILPSILTSGPFTGLLGTTADNGKWLASKAFSVVKRNLEGLASWIPCKRKPRQEPVSYVPPQFARAYTTLTSRDPSAILELQEVLKKLGLYDQMKIELIKTGTLLEMRLFHGGQELVILAEKYKELAPYFSYLTLFSGDDPSFCLESEKGIFEDTATKQLLMRSLLKAADRHFSFMTPLPVQCDLQKVAQSSDPEILKEIYQRKSFKKLCVGERHREVASKKFIIDNLVLLRSMGITTLFMEFFNYDTMQPYLDEYFASESDQMHPLLEMVLAQGDRLNGFTSPYSYTDLVREAKKARIRVVGIDTSLSYELPTGADEERIRGMNYAAQKIIQYEQGDGKCIILLGGAHAPTLVSSSNYSIPGIADLLQSPYIMIQDNDNGTSKGSANLSNVPFTDCWTKKHVHLLLERPHLKKETL